MLVNGPYLSDPISGRGAKFCKIEGLDFWIIEFLGKILIDPSSFKKFFFCYIGECY